MGFNVGKAISGGEMIGSFGLATPISDIMGGKAGKGSISQQGGQDISPWGPQAERLQKVFGEANKLYDKPLQYYQGNTVAGFNPLQQQAQNLTAQRAISGSPVIAAAQAQNRGVAGGQYLDATTNPYYNQLLGTAGGVVGPGASASQAGRYSPYNQGGDLAQRMATDIVMPEFQFMQGARAMAQPLAQERDYDIGKLAAVGEEQQGMNQANVDAARAKHEFEQMENWNRLSMFMNAITGNYGSGQTSNTTRKGK